VESESFRLGVERHTSDVLHVVFFLSSGDSIVNTRRRELVTIFKNLRTHVGSENARNKVLIVSISYTATIVDFGTDIVKYLEGYKVIRLDENLELAAGYSEFFKHECVLDIPANRSELTSVLYNSVEEYETPEKFLEDFRLIAALKVFVINTSISTEAVKFETRWGFKSHLDGVLEYRHRETFIRHGGEPEAEISMLGVIQILNDTFKSGHEGGSQMTVHKEYPSSHL